MDHPHNWLALNSPYRPHGFKRHHFSFTQCCGESPKQTELEVSGKHPKTGRDFWFPVYQCQICGKRYLWLDSKGKYIDSLLKYEVRKRCGKP